MPTDTNLLRRLSATRFQVHIADRVAAVLRLVGDTKVEIWTLADAPLLLVTLIDETRLSLNPARIAARYRPAIITAIAASLITSWMRCQTSFATPPPRKEERPISIGPRE